MAIPHAKPGSVIDLHASGPTFATARTTTLVKTDQIEVVRLVMGRGKTITEHKARGEITVQCLGGKITVTALGATRELTPGQMLYLGAGEPHSVECIDDAAVLLTIVLHP